MSVGSTLVELAKVVVPLLSTLGGVWLGYRIERWRRTDERDTVEEQHRRDQAAAARSAEADTISSVQATAVAWRREGAEASNLVVVSEQASVEFNLGPLIEAHAAFGKALATASVLFDDEPVLDALAELSALYEDGFLAQHFLYQEEYRNQGAGSFDDIQQALRRELKVLQEATRRHFNSGERSPATEQLSRPVESVL